MAIMLRQLSSLLECRQLLSRSFSTSSHRFQLLRRSSHSFSARLDFYSRRASFACRSHQASRRSQVFSTLSGAADSTRASEGCRMSSPQAGGEELSGWASCSLSSQTSLSNFRISIWKLRGGSSLRFVGSSFCCLIAWASFSRKARSFLASSSLEDEPLTRQQSSATSRHTPPCFRQTASACSLATRLIPYRSSSRRVSDRSRDSVCSLPCGLQGCCSCRNNRHTRSTCSCELLLGSLRAQSLRAVGARRAWGSCVFLEKCMDLLIRMHNIIMSEVSAKVVVIGAVGVGKSSLTVRYVRQQFTEEMESTLGAVYFEKQIAMQGQKIKFQFWDTAGQERYKAIARIYYKDCRVALVVYDVTSRPSFQAMKIWVQELKANGPQDVVLAIVGNKIDLQSTDGVSYEQAQSYAQSLSAIFKYTSAKDGKGVQQLFQSVAEILLQRAPSPSKNEKLKRPLPKKGCC